MMIPIIYFVKSLVITETSVGIKTAPKTQKIEPLQAFVEKDLKYPEIMHKYVAYTQASAMCRIETHHRLALGMTLIT